MKKNLLSLVILAAMLLVSSVANAQKTVLEEGFETTAAGQLPAGWTQDPAVAANHWAVETGTAFTFPASAFGNGRVKFFSGMSPAAVKLISPVFNITAYEQPILVFSYAAVPYQQGGIVDSLKVWYRYSSTAAWRLAKSYGASDVWKTDTIDFTSKTSTFQVAFEGIDHSAHGVAIDNVIITGRPTCQEVNGVRVFGVTHNAALMTWRGALTASYTIKLYDHAANPATDTPLRSDVVEYQTNHSYSGLNASTTYYYYIQSDCVIDGLSVGDISGWVSGTFTTACPPVTSLTTSFDAVGDLNCWTLSGTGAGAYPITLPTNQNINIPENDFPYGECLTASPSARSGRSLLFNVRSRSASDYTKLYAVSPRLADTIDLRTKQLDFWLKVSNVKMKLHVMVSEYRDDFSNAEEIGTVKLTSTSYEKVILTFENMSLAEGRYIVFYVDGSETNIAMGEGQCPQLNIDDLNLRVIDNCSATTKVSVFNTILSGTSATLSWNATGAVKFRVKVNSSSINPAVSAGTIADATLETPSIALTDLRGGTPYFYYVQPICESGVEGVWSSEQTFSTECLPEGAAIPFYENFDAYATNTMPNCWSYTAITNNNSSGLPYIANATSAPSMPNVLYLYNYSQTTFVSMPKMNADLKDLQISFKFGIGGLQVPLSVGVMTDPNDANTYVEVTNFTATVTSSTSNFATTGQQKTVKLNTYKGAGKYVAFKYTGNVAYMIDNVVIEPLTDCFTPETFSVIDNSATTLTLDWKPANGETTWEVSYGAQGFVLGENSPKQTATTHPFVLTGLTEYVTYDIYLRSACGNERGAWVGPVSYKTFSYATAPYFNDFEDAGEASVWTFAKGTSTMNNAWIIGSAANDDNNGKALYISNSGGMDNNFSATETYVYAYRPFDLPVGVYDFSFKWRWDAVGTKEAQVCTAQSGGLRPTCTNYVMQEVPTTNGVLAAYLVPYDINPANTTANNAFYNLIYNATNFKGTTATLPADWIALSPILKHTDNSWEKSTFTKPVLNAGKYNLVLVFATREDMRGSGINQNYINSSIFVDATGLAAAIDSVQVLANTTLCIAPEQLAVSNVSYDKADISFVNPNANNWTVKVFTAATATPESTTANLAKEEIINSTTYTIEGLNHSTQYYVYVKANCGNLWTPAVTFRTLCEAVDVPLTENFDSYTSSSYVDCWHRLYSGTSASPSVFGPYLWGTTTVGGNTTKSLAFYGNNTTLNTFAVLPAMKADVKALQISFRYALENDNPQGFYLVTGVMDDPSKASTFVGLDTAFVTTGDIWKQAIVLFDDYKGTGKHIALQMLKHVTGNNTRIFVDDIVVDSIKGCVSPKEITVSDITTTTAKVSWRVLGETLNYRVKVTSAPQARWEDAGDIYDNTVNNANQLALSNLKRNTLYYVYVRTDCGDGTYSVKTSEKTFRTLCPPTYSLPLDDDFESYTIGELPSCWVAVQNPMSYGSSVRNLNFHSIDDNMMKSFGEKSLMIASSTNVYALIATPEISIGSLSNAVMSFMAIQTSTSDRLIVGAISDVNDPNTFVGVDTLSLPSVEQWAHIGIDFSSYTGNAKRIAFKLSTSLMSGRTVYIDNLYIRDRSVTCPDVGSLMATMVRATTANISWVELSNATGYEYKVANHDIDPETDEGNIVATTAVPVNFVNLTGLTGESTYYVYVRSICSATSKGYWSRLVFNTLCGTVKDIPFTENFNGYGDIPDKVYFPQCWTYNVTEVGSIAGIDKRKPYLEVSGKSLQMEAVFDVRDGSYSVVQAVTPELNVGDTIRKHQLKFKVKANNINAPLIVGVMSDPSDASTFVPYDTVKVTAANTLEEKLINLLYVPSTGHYIAFRLSAETAKTYNPGTTFNEANSRGGYTVNIDDIEVRPLDACMPPYKAKVDVRPTKAFVSWLAGDETATEWTYYATTSSASYSGFSATTTKAELDTWYNDNTKFFYMNGSNTVNAYAIRIGRGTVTEPLAVLNNLDKIESGWSTPVYPEYIKTFAMYLVSSCGKAIRITFNINNVVCTAINTLPYSENFDRHGVGAADTVFSAFPDCWTREDTYTVDNVAYPYIVADRSLYFYSTENTYSFAALPQIVNSIDLTKQSIYFRAKGVSATDTLQLGFSNGTYATFEKFADIVPSTDWANYEVELAGYTGSKRYVSFLSKTSSENKVYIDDLIIDATPFCIAPAVTVEEVTKTSFRLSWHKGINTLSSYQTLRVAAGASIDGLTPVTTQDSVFYGDNLPANSAYDVYVRANCTNGLNSDWTKVTVRTLQEPAKYPYVTDFSTDATNWAFENVNQPNKWIIGQATGYLAAPSLYITSDGTSYGYDIDNAANVYAYRTIAIPAGPQTLTFWWKAGGETGADYMNVYLVPQSVDFATATPLNATELSGNTQWTKADYNFYVSESNTEAYNLVFQWKNNASGGSGISAAVDNISFAASTECTVPEQLEARQITPVSAMLSWVSYNANRWNVKIFTSPQSNPTNASSPLPLIEATSLPVQATGLQPATAYYFYVESECNPDVWSQAGIFTTLCPPVTALNEPFNSVPANCWGLYEGLLSNVTADSWNLKAANTGWTGSSADILTGQHAVLNVAGAGTKHWLVSPAITLTQNSSLAFDLALTQHGTLAPISNTNGQFDDKFAVAISEDGGKTWTAANTTVWNNDGTGKYRFNDIARRGDNGSGETADIDLFNYTGKTVRIAFYGESTVDLESNDIHIDNARIECRNKRTFNVNTCAGYRYQAYGFNIAPEQIATAGNYQYSRVVPSTTGGCDTTYVLNLTVISNTNVIRRDTICSNGSYSDADFSNLKETGIYYSTPKTAANGCDSIIELHLTVNPAYSIKTEAIINANQLPWTYHCRTFDVNTKSGIYDITCKTVNGCDSIITLTLTVNGAEGLFVVENEAFTLSPNPSKRGEKLNINYDFTPEEQAGLQVEIFNTIGVRTAVVTPAAYPIVLDEFSTAGVYVVRITTGSGKTMHAKAVIK